MMPDERDTCGSPGSQLLAQAANVVALPSLSPVLERAMLLTQADEASAIEIADIIGSDPSLAAQVLRLANSASFGLHHRVSSIRQAIVLLGFDVLKSLLLGAALFETMQDTMRRLWAHSLSCALVAGAISQRAMYAAPEEVYAAGLLHDLGKVFWGASCPTSLRKMLACVHERDLTMLEAEEAVLGVTHPQIARRMMQAWGLPDSLAEPVACHHDPLRACSFVTPTFAVHLADCLVRAYGVDDGCTDLVPILHPATLRTVGITEDELLDIISGLDLALMGVDEGLKMAS
jgi:HD-like signal output (HDOD) protein